MSVIADISIPADQFALGHLLEIRSGIQVRLESMIPTGDDIVPYFWVESRDAEAIEEALEGSDLVEEVRVIDRAGEESLFRVKWTEDINGIVEALDGSEAVVLEGQGHGDHWSFQLRFPEYEALSEFYRGVVEKDISINLDGVHNPIEAPDTTEFGLTPEQREILVMALETGYFAVPRDITMVELAEELGISDSAASQRLRRGLTKVVSSTLMRDATT